MFNKILGFIWEMPGASDDQPVDDCGRNYTLKLQIPDEDSKTRSRNYQDAEGNWHPTGVNYYDHVREIKIGTVDQEYVLGVSDMLRAGDPEEKNGSPIHQALEIMASVFIFGHKDAPPEDDD